MKLKEKLKKENHNKTDRKKLTEISKKHIKNGSYAMVMSVIFIAVVIVINNDRRCQDQKSEGNTCGHGCFGEK